VAKWKHGTYVEDESATNWVKIKNPAYTQSQGWHEQFTKIPQVNFVKIAVKRTFRKKHDRNIHR
jgi:hypothetical protein